MDSAGVITSRERNIELLLLSTTAAFLWLGWRSLDATGFVFPPNTTRILTQFVVAALGAHLTCRLLCPAARPEVLASTVFLGGVGMVMVLRLVPGSAQDQANWAALAAVAFAAGGSLGARYGVLKRYTYSSGAAALAILLATGIFGETIQGARLWVNVGGQSVQTTELIKAFFVVFLAGYLADSASVLASPTIRVGGRTYSGVSYLAPLAAVLLGAVAALALLRDLGSIALLLLLTVAMLYVATGRVRFVALGLLLLAATGAFGYEVFDHAHDRVETWLDPEADPLGSGYQSLQAMYALEAGGVTGEGLGRGQPNTIPAAATDYVFSAIGEELGLAGAAGIALLYVVLLFAGLRVSMEAPDTFGRLLAAAIALLMAIQAAVIIGGNLRLIPTTGITLPFVSYGGSSLVVNFGLAGVLAGVSHASRKRYRPA